MKLFSARLTTLISIFFSLLVFISNTSQADVSNLSKGIKSDFRSPKFINRDEARHPGQTLAFFGITPSMSVVEIWPGTGWYTEILAPYLKEKGVFYAAHFPEESKIKFFRHNRNQYKRKLAEHPHQYGKVKLTELSSKRISKVAPESSADMVLTFRNVHNWVSAGGDKLAFISFYNALKPGGILGVVEHRAKAGTSIEEMKKSGYVTEKYVISLAESAGFSLAAKSEINANPKDTKNHPKGVWTLPPTLRLKETNKQAYLEIGESDRMTLKFIKQP